MRNNNNNDFSFYENADKSPSQVGLLDVHHNGNIEWADSIISSPGAGGSSPLMPILSNDESSPKDILTDSDSIFDEPTAGFASCSINLLKTILGAGMLAMPSAFAALGYVIGTLFVLVAGTLAAFGLHLFVACSQLTGPNTTVNKLANLTYPKLTVVFDFAIALKCFGVALSYLVVIGDMMPGIAQGIGCEYWLFLDRTFWLATSAILLTPLAFLKKMDSLKYTSFAGLLSVVYLVGVAAWNFLKPDAVHAPPEAGIQPVASLSFAALKSFSVFVFSFTCHQNIFPIQREARDGSLRFMNRVILFCVYLSAGIYFIFSMISYANFGQTVQGNVFKNYPSDKIEMILARILFAFLSAFSYPLQTLPCRMSIENLIPLSKSTRKEHTNTIHIVLTSLILLGTFTIAFFQDNLVLISGMIGTIAGIPICYILPFVFYYKLTEHQGWTRKKVAAAALAGFGVIAMITSGVSLICSILYPNAKA